MSTIPEPEIVPKLIPIHQASEDAAIYRCLRCRQPIFSQYTGNLTPIVKCEGGPSGVHRLIWDAE